MSMAKCYHAPPHLTSSCRQADTLPILSWISENVDEGSNAAAIHQSFMKSPRRRRQEPSSKDKTPTNKQRWGASPFRAPCGGWRQECVSSRITVLCHSSQKARGAGATRGAENMWTSAPSGILGAKGRQLRLSDSLVCGFLACGAQPVSRSTSVRHELTAVKPVVIVAV
jgi:hypothetical protein